MIKIVCFIGVSILVLSTLGRANERAENAEEKSYTLCKNGTVVRTIRVFRPPGSRQCKVTYTKDGVDQKAGAAKEQNICDGIRKKIQTNLEKQNWKCKDVSVAVHDAPTAESSVAPSNGPMTEKKTNNSQAP